ncbi:hypothetical protein [Streptomyces sp. BE133]|uniref:hypothetical protein n=1 Tax=Streptomyces sp. BE133 TaxID=3002523 RepID=UPI002E79D586|nr:hypothetical protein [Streptomyces sp. BE133]MEE1806638.1 hypothetical protein [Streptomyces sp. BE133]
MAPLVIQLQPNSLSALTRWFPARTAGPATPVEHVLGTTTGRPQTVGVLAVFITPDLAEQHFSRYRPPGACAGRRAAGRRARRPRRGW